MRRSLFAWHNCCASSPEMAWSLPGFSDARLEHTEGVDGTSDASPSVNGGGPGEKDPCWTFSLAVALLMQDSTLVPVLLTCKRRTGGQIGKRHAPWKRRIRRTGGSWAGRWRRHCPRSRWRPASAPSCPAPQCCTAALTRNPGMSAARRLNRSSQRAAHRRRALSMASLCAAGSFVMSEL